MQNTELSKRIKQIRNRRGLSQEELSHASTLSLRTIQRIENGETTPHGDSLKKLAFALQVSPDEIIDWQIQEDTGRITMLNLSQLAFVAFPLLGIILPLVIWILNRNKIKDMDSVGKSVLNFQISWTLLLFILNSLLAVGSLLIMRNFRDAILSVVVLTATLYILNIILIIKNTISYSRNNKVNFPSFQFLK